ncbi:MAG: ATP-binding protein [Bacteroidales bacterium]|jgi:DNA-binding transcriptional ArsR family regulator|nr:ATP-binding protein [Bacteroidales bacterium]
MQKNTPYNPFLVAGYEGPAYFCDREQETEALISALKNNRNISVISPRRYGKTGLIHHTFYNILKEDKNTICVYFDIFSTQNLNDFVKLFAENVLGKADSSAEKIIKKISSFFTNFRPTLTFDIISGQPEISVKVETGKESNSLKEIFSYLKQSNKRCYIAIDEFQQIAEYPEKGTEALLRSYIQFLPNVKFIFSGSKQHLMSEIFLSAKRPFYQSTQIMSLSTIDRNKYFQFTQKHFKKNNFSITGKCFDYIYSTFEGHTWYIQAILNRLYEYRQDINSIDIIFKAIYELIRENESGFQRLLDAYSDVQIKLLRAVAKERIVEQITAGDFIAKYELTNPSSVSRALKKLLEKELIYKSDKGYIVYDRFFALWLSMI